MKINEVLAAAIAGLGLWFIMGKKSGAGPGSGGGGNEPGNGGGAIDPGQGGNVPGMGTLAVQYSPNSATVLIAGDVYVAPMTLAAGTYNYHAFASGYVEKSGTVTIKAYQTTNLTISLQPVSSPSGKGSLALTLNPGRATFYVGSSLLNGSGTYTFDPGSYNWSCGLAGYKSKSGTFTIQADKTTFLTVNLEESDIPIGVIPEYKVTMSKITAKDQNPKSMAFVYSTLTNNSNVAITPKVIFKFHQGSWLPGAGDLLNATAGMTATVPKGGTYEFGAAHIVKAGEATRYDVTAEVWINDQLIYSRQDDDVFFGI